MRQLIILYFLLFSTLVISGDQININRFTSKKQAVLDFIFYPIDQLNNLVNIRIISFVYNSKAQTYEQTKNEFIFDDSDDLIDIERKSLNEFYLEDTNQFKWMKDLKTLSKLDRMSKAVSSPYPESKIIPKFIINKVLGTLDFLMGKFYLNYRVRGPIPSNIETFEKKIFPDAKIFGVPAPKLPANIRLEYEREEDGDYVSLFVLEGSFTELFKRDKNGIYTDFTFLNDYKPFSGFMSSGSKLKIKYNPQTSKLESNSITYFKNDSEGVLKAVKSHKGQKDWPLAQKVWGSGASFLTTAMAHLTETHLTVAEGFTDAQLQLRDHPLRGYLETFGYETKRTNSEVGTLVKDDNAAVMQTFSFPSSAVHSLMNTIAQNFDIGMIDPIYSAKKRNMVDSDGKLRDPLTKEIIDYPFYNQTSQLFRIFMKANLAFLKNLYGDNEDKLAQDKRIINWVNDLRTTMGGVDNYMDNKISFESIAKLSAIFMYNGTVRHESLGNNTYNVTGYHPLFPTRILEDSCLLQNEDSSTRYNYVSYLTMVRLRTFEEGVEKAMPSFLSDQVKSNFGPFKTSRRNSTQKRARAIQITKDLLSDLREYDKKVLANKTRRNFDLLFKNMESSVSI